MPRRYECPGNTGRQRCDHIGVFYFFKCYRKAAQFFERHIRMRFEHFIEDIDMPVDSEIRLADSAFEFVVMGSNKPRGKTFTENRGMVRSRREKLF